MRGGRQTPTEAYLSPRCDIDCRRRDPPRLRRRNLLLLLRLRLRPAVSHAGPLFRLVLLPASTAASTA